MIRFKKAAAEEFAPQSPSCAKRCGGRGTEINFILYTGNAVNGFVAAAVTPWRKNGATPRKS